jgi:glycerol-3-phosphate acyltransferase PlsX
MEEGIGLRIAIDAMGGDLAPEEAVKGALEAAAEWPDTTFILVGDEQRVRPLLNGRTPPNVELRHAAGVIGPDDEPVRAVRRKKDASMVVAARMVKEGEADAMLSAGNTGALMAAGLLVVGRIPGVERPALAQTIPSVDDVGVLALDLGANVEARPEHLHMYAVMGSLYRQLVHGMERPRVGLLNVGTEEGKGTGLMKETYELLGSDPGIRFTGNVEARDVLQRACDVLVCDGFSGNIMLKSFEGAAALIMGELKRAFMKNAISKLAAAVVKPGLSRLRRKMDYKEYGGAPLLGLAGIVVKCHGSSDARAFRNGIRQARDAVRHGLIRAIAEHISGKEGSGG